LRPEAKDRLTGVDHIIHAGDIGGPEIIPILEKIAPVTAIKGNIDRETWAASYSDDEVVILAGRLIYVLHNRHDLNLDPTVAGFDIVISGHSHKPNIETIDNVLYLNPGSAGPRRFTLPIALAIMELTDGSIVPRIHEIPA
jgi:putative phosphoesterase